MKLFTVFYQYAEHEMENEVYASETGDTADARRYLLQAYGGDDGYMDDESQLTNVSTHPFTTVFTSTGDPYRVAIS